MRLLRILCLHGFHGRAEALRQQLQSLTAGTEALAEYVYVDAPILADGESGWWNAVSAGAESGGKHYQGWERSFELLQRVFEQQGPFDGVLGFSQGAALTGLLVGLRNQVAQPVAFDFAILVGGFVSNDPRHAELYSESPGASCPSLHVIGRSDSVVPPEASRALAARFEGATLIEHAGGHVIPRGPEVRRKFTEFLDAQSRSKARAPALDEFLSSTPHVADGGQSFVSGLIAQLVRQGVPLWRVSLSLLTKHPEVLWRSLQWQEGSPLAVIDRQHQTFREPYFTRSPVALLHAGERSLRVRLLETDGDFPICRDLRSVGGTDYYAQALPFSNGERSYVSWATREPGGFDDSTIAAFDAAAPALARRVELESAYHATSTLLNVYLGQNAARRVLEGAFRRGEGELIRAAVWFCDLRGFTQLSDRSSPSEVVKLLDAYFDRVTLAITAHGGEVLKFVGDAILAIFPTSGSSDAAACENALAAAELALAGQPPLELGIALHLGEVMYGNIGSKERLDFTVISATVNETCRLEALCKPLGTPLILSAAFASQLKRDDLIELGEHALKGVSEKARVLGLRALAKA